MKAIRFFLLSSIFCCVLQAYEHAGQPVKSPLPILSSNVGEQDDAGVLTVRRMRDGRILSIVSNDTGKLIETSKGSGFREKAIYLVVFDPKTSKVTQVQLPITNELVAFQSDKAVIAEDGTIYVAGTVAATSNKENRDVALLKFSADGKADTAYGKKGALVTDAGGKNDSVNSIALDSKNPGAVLLGVDAWGGGKGSWLYRINAKGELDTTFGQGWTSGSGYRKLVKGSDYEATTTSMILPQPDGSIIALVHKSGAAGDNEYMNFWRNEVARRESFKNADTITLLRLNSAGVIQSQAPVDTERRNTPRDSDPFIGTRAIKAEDGGYLVTSGGRANSQVLKIMPNGETNMMDMEIDMNFSRGTRTPDGSVLFPTVRQESLGVVRMKSNGNLDYKFGPEDKSSYGYKDGTFVPVSLPEEVGRAYNPRFVSDQDGKIMLMFIYRAKGQNSHSRIGIVPVPELSENSTNSTSNP